MATKRSLESLRTSPTSTERLYEIFHARYKRVWDDAGSGMREHDIVEVWEDILRGMKGVEHIRKFSGLAEPADYLMERVNEPGWNRLVIRDPGERGNFIIVDRAFAERALVLGGLP